MCYQDSIEVDELRHPLHVHARCLIADTEGAGRFRGALGAYSEFSPVDCDMVVAYVSDGNVNAALGTRGGLAGAVSAQFRKRKDGTLEPLPACDEVTIAADEAMVSISCGGGGYGPPHERDIARVTHDVREGWVSLERARTIYGVVLSDTLEVDAKATMALRQSLVRARLQTTSPSPGQTAP
jgi:N-methylhydantoinase B